MKKGELAKGRGFSTKTTCDYVKKGIYYHQRRHYEDALSLAN